MTSSQEVMDQPDMADSQGISPEDIQAELDKRQEAQKFLIQTLEKTLLDKRKRAVEYRLQLGIEQEWLECEEQYEGIDDANRATEQPVWARMAKPTTASGGTAQPIKLSGTRSTAFLNITRPYCDAASARVADMLFPTDDRNFSFKPTPIPELESLKADNTPIQQAIDKGMQVNPKDAAAAATVGDLAKAEMQKAEEASEKAQTRVDDWLVECQYHGEGRKVIEDCARLGTGVIKGPTPIRRKYVRAKDAEDGSIAIKVVYEISPESKRVDPWDCFPDPSCGENVHNGSYFWERERLSAKQVRELGNQEGYLAEQISALLEEGPNKVNIISDQRYTLDDERFEAWYFYGQMSGDELSALYPGEKPQTAEVVDVVATVINDRIVKAVKSHLDSGEIPYDFIVWQRRVGMPFGIGIVKQISVPQRMVNAGVRNLNDNAALSNGPQIVMLKGVVTPADGSYEITPRKMWYADANSDIKDVREAFMTFDIPCRQQELLAIVEFGLKMAEQVTGLYMLMQGSQGAAPDTVGGMVILNNNGNTVLRRIAKMFDDMLTEPHMRRYYEWIMLYGDDSEKGDFTIDARGSSSLVDRDMQQHAIAGMGSMVIDQRFGGDPRKWFREFLKLNKIQPDSIMMSDEEFKAAQQAQADAENRKIKLMQLQQNSQFQHETAMKEADLESNEAIATATNFTNLAIKALPNDVGNPEFSADYQEKAAGGRAPAQQAVGQ